MVVDYRKDIEKTYSHLCNIFIKREVKNLETFETKFITDTYIENQPCRISFNTSNVTASGEIAEYSQQIKLFIDEKIKVLEGSSIEVTISGEKTLYKQSGKPMLYPCHQEILLKVDDIA